MNPPNTVTHKKKLNIVLAGNPNAGKSSLFNHLTGLRQKVGNYPGVTIDRKTGTCELPNGEQAHVADLPGTYSFYPNSLDERIALQSLLVPSDSNADEVIVYVLDVTQLERHMLLFTQIADLKRPIILAVNMLDVAKNEGIHCDLQQLEQLLGIAVVGINGRTGEGITNIKRLLAEGYRKTIPQPFFDADSVHKEAVALGKQVIGSENSYTALLTAHHASWLSHLSALQREEFGVGLPKEKFNSIPLQVEETMQRYDRIVKIVNRVITEEREGELSFTDKLDRILTHPVWGVGIFLLILFLLFQAIFAWAAYPMDLIDAGFASLVGYLKDTLPEHMLTDLLTEGVIAGLGGIIIFVPQITILFCLIAFLEDIGYMSRAVFLSDNLMRKFGLNGKSVVSLISGVACAIPAVMATRTISNWKERTITMFVTPLMSCSARIPVFTVLIAFVVPQKTMLGIFNLQGLAMTCLYLLGATAALLSAWVMKKILKQREVSSFMMELPSYKMPHWKNIVYTVWGKVQVFVVEAGKVILVISIVLWFLASYGPGNSMEEAAAEVQRTSTTTDTELVEKRMAAKQLEASYAGRLGKFIEPVIAPLGFDWKMGIALITSFAAREVFVGTMATIYSVGDSDAPQPLIQKLRTLKDPETGKAVYDVPTSLSLLLFYLFAMQCMSTLAVVYRETNGWKWPLLQLVYMSGLAYVVSLLAYQLLS